MNHRERILAAIRHQPVDRLPTDIWATPEVWDRLRAHLGVSDTIAVLDKLDIDGIIEISPRYTGALPARTGDYRVDEWGMGYRVQSYSTGEYDEQVYYPMAEFESIEEIRAFPWPSPDDYDFADLARRAAWYPDRAVGCGYTAVFFWHNRLRGLERSLLDPLEKPEFTQYLVERLSEFFTEYHRRCFEATRGLVHTTQVTDDFGAQHGLMISPRAFDRFYRDAMQRAIHLAHEYDLLVFHHDDGDCRKLIPRLVEMGIQVLNPIQWRCGDWDLAALKAEYGSRICFHSAVDNQHTLPFGTAEDVRKEVRYLMQTLGSDGTGFIVAPCHNLQPVTPIENILALYETVTGK